jgi:hypothetical protein
MNTDELRHLETNTATIERLTRERDQAVARDYISRETK